jgi:hypothetical protein
MDAVMDARDAMAARRQATGTRAHPAPHAPGLDVGIVLAALLAALVASCATPQTKAPEASALSVTMEAREQHRVVIAQRRAEQARALGIHHRLSAANLDFCSVSSASMGAAFETSASYPKDFETAAREAGIGARPVVAAVLDDSPAAAAGLRVGDVVMAVDGRRVAASALGLQKLRHDIAAGAGRMEMSIMRADGPLTLGLMRETICGYPLRVVNDRDLNARADGASILLQRGMLRFAASDEDLALVIAHEMAHNAMGHVRARSRSEIAGLIGGVLVDGAVPMATGVQTDAFGRIGAHVGASA